LIDISEPSMPATPLSLLLPLAVTGLLSLSAPNDDARPTDADSVSAATSTAALGDDEAGPGASATIAATGGTAAAQNRPGTAGSAAFFACFGSVHPYGVGTPGSGGFVPTLTTTGCPDAGAVLQVEVAKGLGGAPAQLAIGSLPLSMPFLGGTLLVQPLTTFSATLSGPIGVPGGGAASFAFTIPGGASSVGTLLYAQAFVLDSGGPALGALSRGLSIVLG